MRISVSVAVPSTAASPATRCGAQFEAEVIDQGTLERMAQTLRQCDAVIRRASHPSHKWIDSPPTSAPKARDSSGPNGKRFATERQIKAIESLAQRHGIELERLLQDRFGVAVPSELSISEASAIISGSRKPPAAPVTSG